METLESIAELKELTCGFCVYVLKTANNGVCTFLQDNRCAVYAARPFTCRIYPFSPKFKADGSADWELCLEQSHHFRGGHVTAREWQRRFLQEEDILFFREEDKRIPLIGELLHEIPEARLREAEVLTLSFYYFAYDFSEPFLPIAVFSAVLFASLDSSITRPPSPPTVIAVSSSFAAVFTAS